MHVFVLKNNRRWTCVLDCSFSEYLFKLTSRLFTRWVSLFELHTVTHISPCYGLCEASGGSVPNSWLSMQLLCIPLFKFNFGITCFILSFIWRFCNCFPGEGVVGTNFMRICMVKSLGLIENYITLRNWSNLLPILFGKSKVSEACKKTDFFPICW